jgi:hypothetical protein
MKYIKLFEEFSTRLFDNINPLPTPSYAGYYMNFDENEIEEKEVLIDFLENSSYVYMGKDPTEDQINEIQSICFWKNEYKDRPDLKYNVYHEKHSRDYLSKHGNGKSKLISFETYFKPTTKVMLSKNSRKFGLK